MVGSSILYLIHTFSSNSEFISHWAISKTIEHWVNMIARSLLGAYQDSLFQAYYTFFVRYIDTQHSYFIILTYRKKK